MRFDIITIFPEAFESYFGASILARARRNKLIDIRVHDLRRWATDRRKTVDDKPYGGGPGMVLKVEPIYRAVQFLKSKAKNPRSRTSSLRGRQKSKVARPYVVLFSAKGNVLAQAKVRQLAKKKHLILICGHYEGVDERVARRIADEEISIGEYVLTGGEVPAMALVDAVSRLVPGALGKKASLKEESFSKPGWLEYPQYTRPEVFNTGRYKDRKNGREAKGWRAPKTLLSGDHKKIAEWRKSKSKVKTQNAKLQLKDQKF